MPVDLGLRPETRLAKTEPATATVAGAGHAGAPANTAQHGPGTSIAPSAALANAGHPGPPSNVAQTGAAKWWEVGSRRVKIGVSAALLCAGAFGIFSESHFVATHNAIVSAYVVSLRTPIDGTVAGLPGSAGMRVKEGAAVGHVENPRVDQEHLENLRVIEERARSEADAILKERDSLESQRSDLVARSNAYARAVTERLRLQTSEAARLLNAKKIAVRQATADLGRGKKLIEAGIISNADFEKLQAQYDVAVQEEQAQEANLAAVQVAAQAAAKGVHSEPGATNDVAYSRQRSDEIDLHLAEINRDLSALEAQARAAAEDLEKEKQRIELMRRAELVAPVTGVLWKLEAMNGERVGTGDAVAEFVDCNQGFVLAEIPQERVPDIALGGEARVKLSGEATEIPGTVVAVGGDPRKEDNRKFAAFPLQDTVQQLATVRIGLAAGAVPGECVIGRTARVLLPTNRSSVISRLMRRYF